MSTAIEAVLLAGILICSCGAQKARSKSIVLWTPPDIGWPPDLPMSTFPTIPKEMIRSFRIGNMPIIFEETKLSDVQKHFGGTIGNHGDAGDSLAWLCFQGQDAGKPWVFWVTSGEIEGLTSVGGFQWRFLAPPERPDHRCTLIPSDEHGIELPLPLHLGLTKAEVRQVVGRPTRARDDALFFLHEHQEPDHEGTSNLWNSITVVFREGVASVIEADKSTTD
jgi:hypothetical protein